MKLSMYVLCDAFMWASGFWKHMKAFWPAKFGLLATICCILFISSMIVDPPFQAMFNEVAVMLITFLWC